MPWPWASQVLETKPSKICGLKKGHAHGQRQAGGLQEGHASVSPVLALWAKRCAPSCSNNYMIIKFLYGKNFNNVYGKIFNNFWKKSIIIEKKINNYWFFSISNFNNYWKFSISISIIIETYIEKILKNAFQSGLKKKSILLRFSINSIPGP